MRKRFFLCNCKIPMELQTFAEGGEGNGEGGESGGGSGAGSGDGGNRVSFDDFLKEEGNQEEFDRRVQKAINTAVKKEQEKWEALTDDKLSEAEKLAKMSREEKESYMRKKREKELSDREAAVTKKELMAEAKNTLAGKKLPTELADVLTYTDAEACNKSIEVVEKAFQKAVESAVEERLKGGNPPRKAPGSDDTSIEKQIEAIMMGTM